MDEIKIENVTSSDSDTESTFGKTPASQQRQANLLKRTASLRTPASKSIEFSPNIAMALLESEGLRKSIAENLLKSQRLTTFVVDHISTSNPSDFSSSQQNAHFSGAATSITPMGTPEEQVPTTSYQQSQPITSFFKPGVPSNLSHEPSSKAELGSASSVKNTRFNSLCKQSIASLAHGNQEEVVLVTPKSFTVQETNHKVFPTYNPISKDELAVSKSKIKELESWMKKALLPTKNPSILVLSGPTGAGKTTSVQVIAASLNVRVIEWITPMDEFHDVDLNRYPSSNQATKFTDFLLAGSRYETIFEPNTNKKKLILVEDYPNVFLRTPDVFHNVIKLYFEKGRCPLVFITTDGRKKISLDLFPEKLIKATQVDLMHFNAVATSFMMKAIDRIAMLKRRGDVDMDVRKAICTAANGDVRSAENIWHFRFGEIPVPASEVRRMAMVKPKRQKKGAKPLILYKKEPVPHIDSNDASYEKLHSIGRVLYAKREPAPVEGGSQIPDPRGYLRTDPETIVSRFATDSRSFVEIAHENYLSIFSTMDSVAEAADSLSLSDVIMPDHRQDLEHLQEVSFTIAVRGFMTSCNNPITKWNPLRKSRLRDVAERKERFMQRVKDQYAGSPYSLTTAVVDMIPLISNLERRHPYNKFEGLNTSPIPHITDDSEDDS